MAAKNSIKAYVENGYYHIYNRGVNKQEIFNNQQDHEVFLHFLKRYLTPFSNLSKDEKFLKFQPTWRTDIHKKVKLIAFCLMPNHFHLLVKQFVREGMTEFMRALSNSYVRYFNETYERIGPLFQGRFKAILIETTPYLLHLTRYIHLNPVAEDFKLKQVKQVGPVNRSDLLSKLNEYPYSSYNYFLGKKRAEWVQPEEVLECFRSPQRIGLKNYSSYQSFVEDQALDSARFLDELTLE